MTSQRPTFDRARPRLAQGRDRSTPRASVLTRDVYRQIHKGIRLGLFRVTELAGTTDRADSCAVAELIDEWDDVKFVLEGHHEHEDDAFDPLVDLHAPHLRERLDHDQSRISTMISQIDASGAVLMHATPEQRTSLLHGFHLDLAAFTAHYLEHLRYEEEVVLPILGRAIADELDALVAALMRSIPPAAMCTYLKFVVPALAPDEREGLLAAMEAGYQPEVFAMLRAEAEASLAPITDRRAVGWTGTSCAGDG
jgi:hypothetical protein